MFCASWPITRSTAVAHRRSSGFTSSSSPTYGSRAGSRPQASAISRRVRSASAGTLDRRRFSEAISSLTDRSSSRVRPRAEAASYEALFHSASWSGRPRNRSWMDWTRAAKAGSSAGSAKPCHWARSTYAWRAAVRSASWVAACCRRRTRSSESPPPLA
ncbi:hypothetical protein SDC9_157011 [bioreactor metagenome]|uniref:Uncharacterized protein n=1 Tax=bioreactor metagenome TaxID=1076179 RepID=A0A645F8R8_9ZZZZ